MKEVGLPVALAIIMFGMGLGLTVADFTRVFSKPKAFLVGLMLQIISLPILTILIITVFPMSAPFAVGMMILAACPGGVTSNILTYIGRGDVALSVSLTAIISLLGFITVPLITGWALTTYMGEGAPELDLAKTIIGVFVITTVPVVLGMIVRKISAGFADKAEKVFGPLSMIVFIVVVLGALYAERDTVVSQISQAGLPAIILNVIAMFVAASAAAFMALPRAQRTAITLECGLQNATLGIVVALTILGNAEISIPIAVYGLLMLFSGFAYAMYVKSKSQAE
ncbi:MAG: bile acid:sodium symporter family protein [Rhizobiaceae bacterium]|nr:bile acid:sodium symporter family protein [Rhizobiaceae bacterium]